MKPNALNVTHKHIIALVAAAEPFARAWHNADLATNILKSTRLDDKKSGKTLYKLDLPSRNNTQASLAQIMITKDQWQAIMTAYVELRKNHTWRPRD